MGGSSSTPDNTSSNMAIVEAPRRLCQRADLNTGIGDSADRCNICPDKKCKGATKSPSSFNTCDDDDEFEDDDGDNCEDDDEDEEEDDDDDCDDNEDEDNEEDEEDCPQETKAQVFSPCRDPEPAQRSEGAASNSDDCSSRTRQRNQVFSPCRDPEPAQRSEGAASDSDDCSSRTRQRNQVFSPCRDPQPAQRSEYVPNKSDDRSLQRKEVFSPCRDPSSKHDWDELEDCEGNSQRRQAFSPCRTPPSRDRSTERVSTRRRRQRREDHSPRDDATSRSKAPDDRSPASREKDEKKQKSDSECDEEKSGRDSPSQKSIFEMCRDLFDISKKSDTKSESKSGGGKETRERSALKCCKSPNKHQSESSKDTSKVHYKKQLRDGSDSERSLQGQSESGNLCAYAKDYITSRQSDLKKKSPNKVSKPAHKSDSAHNSKQGRDETDEEKYGERIKDMQKGCAYLSRKELRGVCDKYKGYGHAESGSSGSQRMKSVRAKGTFLMSMSIHSGDDDNGDDDTDDDYSGPLNSELDNVVCLTGADSGHVGKTLTKAGQVRENPSPATAEYTTELASLAADNWDRCYTVDQSGNHPRAESERHSSIYASNNRRQCKKEQRSPTSRDTKLGHGPCSSQRKPRNSPSPKFPEQKKYIITSNHLDVTKHKNANGNNSSDNDESDNCTNFEPILSGNVSRDSLGTESNQNTRREGGYKHALGSQRQNWRCTPRVDELWFECVEPDANSFTLGNLNNRYDEDKRRARDMTWTCQSSGRPVVTAAMNKELKQRQAKISNPHTDRDLPTSPETVPMQQNKQTKMLNLNDQRMNQISHTSSLYNYPRYENHELSDADIEEVNTPYDSFNTINKHDKADEQFLDYRHFAEATDMFQNANCNADSMYHEGKRRLKIKRQAGAKNSALNMAKKQFLSKTSQAEPATDGTSNAMKWSQRDAETLAERKARLEKQGKIVFDFDVARALGLNDSEIKLLLESASDTDRSTKMVDAVESGLFNIDLAREMGLNREEVKNLVEASLQASRQSSGLLDINKATQLGLTSQNIEKLAQSNFDPRPMFTLVNSSTQVNPSAKYDELIERMMFDPAIAKTLGLTDQEIIKLHLSTANPGSSTSYEAASSPQSPSPDMKVESGSLDRKRLMVKLQASVTKGDKVNDVLSTLLEWNSILLLVVFLLLLATSCPGATSSFLPCPIPSACQAVKIVLSWLNLDQVFHEWLPVSALEHQTSKPASSWLSFHGFGVKPSPQKTTQGIVITAGQHIIGRFWEHVRQGGQYFLHQVILPITSFPAHLSELLLQATSCTLRTTLYILYYICGSLLGISVPSPLSAIQQGIKISDLAAAQTQVNKPEASELKAKKSDRLETHKKGKTSAGPVASLPSGQPDYKESEKPFTPDHSSVITPDLQALQEGGGFLLYMGFDPPKKGCNYSRLTTCLMWMWGNLPDECA